MNEFVRTFFEEDYTQHWELLWTLARLPVDKRFARSEFAIFNMRVWFHSLIVSKTLFLQ